MTDLSVIMSAVGLGRSHGISRKEAAGALRGWWRRWRADRAVRRGIRRGYLMTAEDGRVWLDVYRDVVPWERRWPTRAAEIAKNASRQPVRT